MGRVDDVIQLCCYLISNEEIQPTMASSVGAVGTVTSMAGAGAMAFGPVGLLVGGMVGTVLTCMRSKDDVKSLPQNLMDLSDQEKEDLYNHLRHVLRNLQWRDFADLFSQVLKQSSLKQQILRALIQYFKMM
ncbi:protein C19orf12 homolog [Limanda limanda]|uniref:protein C19orf12 homolog n=1 Tax=Limanda limanda TaxID=27771 RepID=UPI0029C8E024|nr:protein C19orf12 homolog [Limanda limanda]